MKLGKWACHISMISMIPVQFHHLANEPSDFASAHGSLQDHRKVKRNKRTKNLCFCFILTVQIK